MKTLVNTMFFGIVLAMAGVATAAGTVDPVVGTWTMNPAKSKFDPGPGPKSETRTYTKDKDGISLTVNGVAADGSAISQQSTFKYNGKAYSMSGSPDYDAIALKRVNGSTVSSTMMKSGKKVGVTTRTISGHGQVLTLSTKITGSEGKKTSAVMVFDKQ